MADQRQAKRDYWAAVLADWGRSGLSKTEYARRHGLNYGRLRWWSSQYPHWARQPSPQGSASPEDDSDDEAPEPRSGPSFLTLQPEKSGFEPSALGGEPPAEPLRVTVGGATVEVPAGFSASSLERLLDVLERRS
ncbi:MAG: IS66 family insertion sequence element accessory protein TnpA [Halorhodospira sp.]